MSIDTSFLDLTRSIALAAGLTYPLVAAVCEQESMWNTWAIRYEPAFMAKYVAPLYTAKKITASEAWARAYSWGLMQVMGQVAREAGYTEIFLSKLCNPQDGLTIGCKVLKGKLDRENGDVTAGLLAWNGGGNPNYAAQVLNRVNFYS